MVVPPGDGPDGPPGAPQAPPAGGYGASAPGTPAGPAFGPAPGPLPGGGGGWGPALAVALVILVLFGAFGMVIIIGIRKEMGYGRTAEVKNSLGQIAKDASNAYEAEYPAPELGADTVTRRVCPAASLPVPANQMAISGKKYQSTRSEWTIDSPRNAGFACLRFEMLQPQAYQYRYDATPSSFLAGGRGDLNGNGKFSDYTIDGRVQATRLLISPTISESDPDE